MKLLLSLLFGLISLLASSAFCADSDHEYNVYDAKRALKSRPKAPPPSKKPTIIVEKKKVEIEEEEEPLRYYYRDDSPGYAIPQKYIRDQNKARRRRQLEHAASQNPTKPTPRPRPAARPSR